MNIGNDVVSQEVRFGHWVIIYGVMRTLEFFARILKS